MALSSRAAARPISAANRASHSSHSTGRQTVGHSQRKFVCSRHRTVLTMEAMTPHVWSLIVNHYLDLEDVLALSLTCHATRLGAHRLQRIVQHYSGSSKDCLHMMAKGAWPHVKILHTDLPEDATVEGIAQFLLDVLDPLRIDFSYPRMSSAELPNLLEIPSFQRLSGLSCTKLPQGIERLTSLTTLDMSGCAGLEVVPEAVCNLHALTVLNLTGCSRLCVIPDSIDQVKNLSGLLLDGCGNLPALPSTLGKLTGLTHLHLLGCRALKEVPDTLIGLTRIESLKLTRCYGTLFEAGVTSLRSVHLDRFRYLPASLLNLQRITALTLSLIDDIQGIGQLLTLEELCIDNSKTLLMLPPELILLRRLVTFRLVNSQAWSLPALHGWKNLKHLEVRGSEALLGDNVTHLASLCSLRFSNNAILLLPSSLGQCRCLTRIDLTDCSNLQLLPETIGALPVLQILILKRCFDLLSLPNSLTDLKQIRQLDMSQSAITELPPGFSRLSTLKSLDMTGCDVRDTDGLLKVLKLLSMFTAKQPQEILSAVGL